MFDMSGQRFLSVSRVFQQQSGASRRVFNLDPRVSQLIKPLKLLIAEVSIPNQIPQIEVACGDEESALLFGT